MIVGHVNALREAIIPLAVRGPSGDALSLNAVVDTGFTHHLTLPPKLVRELQLPFAGTIDFELADGSESEFDVYFGEVQWDGQWQEIVVAAANGGALVGMDLMQDRHLHIEVREGGRVVIRSRDEDIG